MAFWWVGMSFQVWECKEVVVRCWFEGVGPGGGGEIERKTNFCWLLIRLSLIHI